VVQLLLSLLCVFSALYVRKSHNQHATLHTTVNAQHNGVFGSLGIDRTPKMYIGGKQKRPDGEYSRTVYGPNRSVVGQVAEGNRKDVRNAVEAAHAAAAGWGKRAAHNRAQICYYIAEVGSSMCVCVCVSVCLCVCVYASSFTYNRHLIITFYHIPLLTEPDVPWRGVRRASGCSDRPHTGVVRGRGVRVD
jgi:hypothetical protein